MLFSSATREVWLIPYLTICKTAAIITVQNMVDEGQTDLSSERTSDTRRRTLGLTHGNTKITQPLYLIEQGRLPHLIVEHAIKLKQPLSTVFDRRVFGRDALLDHQHTPGDDAWINQNPHIHSC